SKSSAGPPPGDLHARSVTAAISRSGLTGSLIRASRRRLSRSERKSFRSAYMNNGHEITKARKRTLWSFVLSCLRGGVHCIGDLLRQRQRPPAVLARHRRRAAGDDRVDEISELAFQRLLIDDLELAALNRREGAVVLDQTPQLDFLGGVIDRQLGGWWKEADPAHAVAADPARREVRNAAVRKAQARVGDVDAPGQHGDTDSIDRFDL